jgi:butyryl-CoA dehydrogenase
MDFAMSEEQEFFRRSIRLFAEREIAPLVKEAEEKQSFPVGILPRLGELGYLGVPFPEELGGSAHEDRFITKLNECIWHEEMSRVCAGIAFGISAAIGGAPGYIIRDFGSEEQKQKYLVPAIKGRKIGAFSLTEPNAGSDAAGIQARLSKDGDHYILNANKTFCSNGNIADFITVAAYSDKDKGVKGGMSVVIVEKGMPGFKIGQKFEKLGFRSAENVELVLSDCRVPRENLVGKEGQGWNMLMSALNECRLNFSADAVGVAQAALEHSIKYSKERVQFGKPIGSFQAVGFKISEMYTKIEAARYLTYHAAWALGRKKSAQVEISAAKLFSSKMVNEITTQAMEIHGGYGFIRDFPVERYFRDARIFYFGYGTEEMQKLVIDRGLGI